MRSKTKELLYTLLWTADLLCHPSYRHIGESFEGWAYRKGLLPQLRRLEQCGLLESCEAPSGLDSKVVRRLHRLSEQGRLLALGGRSPPDWWDRPWDGLWRVVNYDVPECEAAARQNLRRFLQSLGWGRLQRSFWITPDPLDSALIDLNRRSVEVEYLFTLQGVPAAKEPDSAIVRKAWNFPKIQELHEHCLRILRKLPGGETRKSHQATRLLNWGRQEQSAWLAAVSADPLLPNALLPPTYLGKKVWETRVKTLARAGLRIAGLTAVGGFNPMNDSE